MANEQIQIYSDFTPVAQAGDIVEIGVTQTLTNGSMAMLNTASKNGHAKTQSPNAPTVQVSIQGPQIALSEDDISGVYPAPGSTDSPDNYLPHIALTRRTLPWERSGPNGKAPWLALLLVTQADLQEPRPLVASPIGLSQAAAAVSAATAVVKPAVTPAPAASAAPKPLTISDAALAQKAIDAQIVKPGIPPIQVNLPPQDVLPEPVPIKSLSTQAQAPLLAGGFTPDTTVTAIPIPNATLNAILPLVSEIPLLCHAKQVTVGGVSTITSIVIGNRLPDAGDFSLDTPPAPHMALLVSLEGRSDLYDLTTGRPNLPAKGTTSLVVLHYWTFVPSKAADFREVAQALAYQPNGGVLRFGNLPKTLPNASQAPLSGGFGAEIDPHGFFLTPLQDQTGAAVTYRGPLRPFPPPPRSNGFAIAPEPEQVEGQAPGAPPDYSNATAFELGRLLALADSGICEDLRQVHAQFNVPSGFVAMSAVPAALQKPFWGVDMGDPESSVDTQANQAVESPWAFNQNMLQNTLTQASYAGLSGIPAAQAAAWEATVQTVMAQPAPSTTPIQAGTINIDTVTEAGLVAQFPEVYNAGQN
jgi:hypothetical protein